MCSAIRQASARREAVATRQAPEYKRSCERPGDKQKCAQPLDKLPQVDKLLLLEKLPHPVALYGRRQALGRSPKRGSEAERSRCLPFGVGESSAALCCWREVSCPLALAEGVLPFGAGERSPALSRLHFFKIQDFTFEN